MQSQTQHVNGAAVVLGHVVAEHATEAATLQTSRRRLLHAPDARLDELHRHDMRIAAHLDGLLVAEEGAWPACRALMEEPGADEIFVVVVQSLVANRIEHLDAVFQVVAGAPDLAAGLYAGLGWSGRASLRGVVSGLLGSVDASRRQAGVAACAMHRVDPGFATLLPDGESAVRARVLRSIGELGKQEFVSLCGRLNDDANEECQFWAAWSAVLLGDRERGLDFLEARAFSEAPHRARALELALCAATPERGHALLQAGASDAAALRTRVRGAGFIGDPRYAPWLINLMADDKLARLAGESISMITGLDLTRPPFFRDQPPDFESGPTDDPEDESVDLDEDDGLPWPDQAKVRAWWDLNGARFTTGTRHFVGAPPSRAHCIDVLKTGYQRQRIAAAYHLCLLNPGTPLFEWRAPAWRQQRELAQMT